LEYTIDYSGISQITEANIEENNRMLEDCKLGLMTRNQYNLAIGKEEILESEFNEYRIFVPTQGWILNGQNIVQNGQFQ